jgi:geranylgeranylglycerol-phosphate geranylgeranyltransferase
MGKLRGFIRLMRPANCLMMGFAVFVGAILTGVQISTLNWLNMVFGFMTGFTLCAAAMAINDYYDRAIDAINEPLRPLPSGIVNVREVLIFVAFLSAVGFVFAFLISILCLVVAAASLGITGSYLTLGKRSGLPGNFLVSVCVAIPFVYGSLTAIGSVGLNVILFAFMAFLSNTGREITKGIVDVKGDSAEGVKTLAIRFGERNAAMAAVLFYVSAISLTPITWIFGLVSFWFLPFVLVTDVGLAICSAILLMDHSREKARKIKKTVLVLFIFGLLAYLFGAVH